MSDPSSVVTTAEGSSERWGAVHSTWIVGAATAARAASNRIMPRPVGSASRGGDLGVGLEADEVVHHHLLRPALHVRICSRGSASTCSFTARKVSSEMRIFTFISLVMLSSREATFTVSPITVYSILFS